MTSEIRCQQNNDVIAHPQWSLFMLLWHNLCLFKNLSPEQGYIINITDNLVVWYGHLGQFFLVGHFEIWHQLNHLSPVACSRLKIQKMIFFCGKMGVMTPQSDRTVKEIDFYFQTLAVEELKRLCLEQLEVMSKKRIRRILEGTYRKITSSFL